MRARGAVLVLRGAWALTKRAGDGGAYALLQTQVENNLTATKALIAKGR